MTYLLDTNVISELRKGPAADPNLCKWFSGLADEDLYLSVVVVGELRRGIENIRRRDVVAARSIESWLNRLVHAYEDRILPVTVEIAQVWGRFNVPDPLPVIDSLIAATAHVHGLAVATRNTRHMARAGVAIVNPFLPSLPA